MSEVTRILSAIEQGDAQASEELLPLVYQELRRLASQKMAQEKPEHTLQATALVHEAYLRLVDVKAQQKWNGRGHFFTAAAEAMRRILVENARRKSRVRHGGEMQRRELNADPPVTSLDPATILAIEEALSQLQQTDPVAANVVKLHVFAGLTLDEVADAVGLSRATVYRHWSYGRAMLHVQLRNDEVESPG